MRWGFSPVHAARLWRYAYVEGVSDWAHMPELPARFRAKAESELAFTRLPVAVETHSADGFTRKYLLSLPDHHRIETVLMRYTGRVTACISSQAGCAMGCVFCATGQMGFVRHLTAGEIVAQAVHVQQELQAPPARPSPASCATSCSWAWASRCTITRRSCRPSTSSGTTRVLRSARKK